jgi:PAS domain S-box-containing protein
VIESVAGNGVVMEAFRLVVEAAPNAMLMVGRRGEILLANAEAQKLFGHSREALIGRSVDVLVPPRFRDGHSAKMETFFANPTARALGNGRELFALRSDGTECAVEISLNPVETDEGIFVLATILDITERKLIESRMRLVVEAAPNAIVMVDRDGRILFVNSQTEAMFGYDRQELVDQPVEMLVPEPYRKAHPQHRQRFFEKPMTRSMGAGRDLFGVRKDGSEFPVEIGLSPVETEDGLLVLAAIVDITARKQAENALRESETSLRTALQKLERRTAELQEANQSLAQYAYVVSHDIRAPLRAIRNYCDFLREDLSGSLDQEQQEYLDGLEEAVNQAEQLVEDLLLLSRVERRQSEWQPLDLGPFLQELTDSLVVPDDVEIEMAGEWPTLPADATLVRQIFQNLILNAVKFNESSPRRVELGCTRQEGQVCVVHVRDNGIGIDPRHHEQIFGVFQRLHDSEEYEGTGIGLAIVKKAVTKLGGSVRLESETGRGTTFFITLPEAAARSIP